MRIGARQVGRNEWLAAVVVAVIVAAVVIGFVVVRLSQPGPTTQNASVQRASISASDGVKLPALIVSPKSSSSTKKFPLLIIPTSWGAKENAFGLLAAHMAGQGYIVVAYTQRGQTDSGGQIDFAGANTRSDVSTVIDWALKHTKAQPKQIGMLGSSYGGGISLLAAAQDPRIRAVVATSTWANLAGSFAQNDTVSTQGLTTLFTGVRLDAQFQQLNNDLTTDPQAIAQRLATLSPSRSPMSYVSELNHNNPAIMIANGFEDRLLPPRQLIQFFQALTTPKRLQLSPGGHQQIEYRGILGQPDPTINDAVAWFDHYLLGQSNPITTQAPIQLQDVRSGMWHGYRSWPQAATKDTFDLPAPQAGTIGVTPTAWSKTITSGVDTVATSGFGPGFPPAKADLTKLVPKNSVSWAGPKLTAPIQFTGAASAHLGVTSSSSAATFFVYLYDVAPTGASALMSFTPYTATGLSPLTATPVTIGLQPVTWTMPTGDHVEAVIDTVDPSYHSIQSKGTTLTFTSSTSDPATLTTPVG